MSINSVSLFNPYYGRIGVYPNGDPVVFDPKKVHVHKNPYKLNPANNSMTPEQMEAIREILKEKGRIDPLHDKVFIDSRTGELTTWKPGIYDPEQRKKTEKTSKTLMGVLGALTAAALAFIFRGKIKTGALKLVSTVKPYIQTAFTKGKEFVKSGYEAVKPLVEKAGTFIKETFKNGVKFAEPVITTVKNKATQMITSLKNLVK